MPCCFSSNLNNRSLHQSFSIRFIARPITDLTGPGANLRECFFINGNSAPCGS